MAVRWKLEIVQESPAKYSVDDFRAIINAGVAICGGIGEAVYQFNFDSELEAKTAQHVLWTNTVGIQTIVEAFETMPSGRCSERT